jgi:hypothetical protein
VDAHPEVLIRRDDPTTFDAEAPRSGVAEAEHPAMVTTTRITAAIDGERITTSVCLVNTPDAYDQPWSAIDLGCDDRGQGRSQAAGLEFT